MPELLHAVNFVQKSIQFVYLFFGKPTLLQRIDDKFKVTGEFIEQYFSE